MFVTKAILIERENDKHVAALREIDDGLLSVGNVVVDVEYSTMNYKDGLLITGERSLVTKFPMIPGIDFAGVVADSEDPRWQQGDRVVANGFGLGERHLGGLAQRVRVEGDWLVRLPDNVSPFQAAAIGTAGYTAMLCVLRLERLGVLPDDGDILVTGASGGVGGVAVALLSKLGYRVVAATGRMSEADYLKSLGAAEILDRAELAAPGEPMQRQRWAGAIDTAGSHTLVNVIAGIRYGGVVAATGLAHGIDFPATMFPFILRDITLSGVDSVMQPMAAREEAWARLATDLDVAKLEVMVEEIGLSDVIERAPRILAGEIRGRTVVDVNRD